MQRSGRLRRQPKVGTHDATMGTIEESEGELNHPQVRVGVEEQFFERFTHHLAEGLGASPTDPEKKYGIERLKALGAIVFEGTTDPTSAEALMNLIEKYFRAMGCPKDRKVTAVIFLLQKGVEV